SLIITSINKLLFIVLLFISSKINAEIESGYFNLRDIIQKQSFKEQIWGTCWAFSAIHSIESTILRKGMWDESQITPFGLSPYHMDKYSGFTRRGSKEHVRNDWYSGQGEDYEGSNIDNLNSGLIVHLGGDFKVAAAYLSHNCGAVTSWSHGLLSYESNPHEAFKNIKRKSKKYSYYMPKKIEWISSKNMELEIKKSVLKGGSVATMQRMQQAPLGHHFNNMEIHYYHSDEKANHAINIIGWDDSVVLAPLLPGAWIVEDSDHKDETGQHIGPFYIPYSDKYVGKPSDYGPVRFSDIEKINCRNVYSHALHGWAYVFDNNSDKVKNIYSIDISEKIFGVSFYSVVEYDEIEILIIDKEGRLLCDPINRVVKGKGFYFYDLDNCQSLKHETVEVILSAKSKKFVTDGTKYLDLLLGSKLPKEGEPILVESKSAKGQSLYYKNGWNDLYNYAWEKKESIANNTANFSINLYTK
ncbi:hypothetical protein OAT67_08330, partial [Bacteriovoracaceae bacterium]|nr:hypothetical protein [Bacteriovoracaceae bacterium]